MQDQGLQWLQSDQTEYSSKDHTQIAMPINNQPGRMAARESPDPPLEITYKNLISGTTQNYRRPELPVVEECELPLIDLKELDLGDSEKNLACKKLIAEASREWGFFQVINHGIPSHVLEIMRAEQVKLFEKPFEEKKTYKDLNFSAGSYRWGTPSATNVNQLSWSEAFHVPLSDILASGPNIHNNTLSSTMEQFAARVSELAKKLAGILAEEIGKKTGFFEETCLPSSCYIRLNRYPVCPVVVQHPQMLGIMPHTDSDFVTVLQQDGIGGLQLVKDGNWIAVKPNPHALIINIGDLFQAWSNDVYKSVEHRVVANAEKERFSAAYFYCPSKDTVIESDVYKRFSFGEFKKQVEDDVQTFGHKIGLSRFLVPPGGSSSSSLSGGL
ncbi:hypothetical protein ABFS82_13G120800 [Erythranthe guttata]